MADRLEISELVQQAQEIYQRVQARDAELHEHPERATPEEVRGLLDRVDAMLLGFPAEYFFVGRNDDMHVLEEMGSRAVLHAERCNSLVIQLHDLVEKIGMQDILAITKALAKHGVHLSKECGKEIGAVVAATDQRVRAEGALLFRVICFLSYLRSESEKQHQFVEGVMKDLPRSFRLSWPAVPDYQP